MNYQWHYDMLIFTRKGRKREEGMYYEKHHILPKSMGGSDDESNLVYLTAREHFLAHWLLWRIHKNRDTAFAFHTFVSLSKKNSNYSNFSSKGYKEAREAYSEKHRERLIGRPGNRAKEVIQYDIHGNYIAEWPSAAEASRQLEICHISSCCRGEREWAGGFIWKYKNSEIKKSKSYKKRVFTKKRNSPLSEKNKKRISEAASNRKWYNDGKRDFFLKPFESKVGLNPGRISIRKKIKWQNYSKVVSLIDSVAKAHLVFQML